MVDICTLNTVPPPAKFLCRYSLRIGERTGAALSECALHRFQTGGFLCKSGVSVSYTHLDVYKRQPMDIYPEYLLKAIIAGDIDRMEALGLYEVAPEDFALCEFVCSSKVEVQRIVRAGLDMLRAEMA